MSTATVQDITKEMSADATKTGGRLAKSDTALLQAAFPNSPLPGHEGADPNAGTYITTVVSALKSSVSTNTVVAGDMADVQSYWGWSVTVSGEEQPSSGDLTFSGAPDIPNVTTDINGAPIASPYMPNLVPPDSMMPIADNPTSVVLDEDSAALGLVSQPPFIGDGLANPKATSDLIHSTLTEADESGYTLPDDTPVTPAT